VVPIARAAAPCRAILPLKLVEEGPAASIQNNSGLPRGLSAPSARQAEYAVNRPPQDVAARAGGKPPSHMIRREFITLLGGARHRHGVAAAELVGAERGSGAIVVEFSPGRVAR
jgi:hypothetical protein